MILIENTQRLTCLKRLCNTNNISNPRKNWKKNERWDKGTEKPSSPKGFYVKKKFNENVKRSTTDPL